MSTFKSPYPDQEISDLPVTSYMFENVDQWSDDMAVTDSYFNKSYTYKELYDKIKRFSSGIMARGLEPGEVVALIAPNMADYIVVFHGTMYSGGTVTTINPTYTPTEIASQLKDSKATRLMTVSMFAEAVSAVAKEVSLKEIIVMDDNIDAFADVGTEVCTLSELLEHDPNPSHAEIDPAEHLAALPYSSGTTGFPKGVMLTHRNLVANTAQADSITDIAHDDVVVAVLPFFHIYGLQVIMNCSLRYGSHIVTMPRFELEEFLGHIQTHKATRLYLVPPIILALAKHPVVDNYDLSSLDLVTSGAAPLGEDMAVEAATRINVEILQGYGLTETSPLTHGSLRGSKKLGSVGNIVSNSECRIVDVETGENVEPGTEGEILIRGPHVMKGYLNNPEATAETIDSDGWLHTGDIGYTDSDGDYYIVDRAKELIKYKGFQVAPAELEAFLLTNPKIADAAVIGIPDDEAGEVPKAFVVLKEGQEATPEEMITFVEDNDELSNYKKIRACDIVAEIPKSPTGKILRRLLRDQEKA